MRSESKKTENKLSIHEKSVGYRYGQEVRVLDIERNTILAGKVTGIMSEYKMSGQCKEWREAHPHPTVSVQFTTVPNAYFKEGYSRTIDFLPDTKLPEYKDYHDSFKLLD